MKESTVVICDKKHAVNNLTDLLSIVEFEPEMNRRVLIKPNICGYYHASLDLLSSIIDFLIPHSNSVIIGDTASMVHDPKTQYEKLGINTLLRRYGDSLDAVDLSEEEWTKVSVPKPHVLKEVPLPHRVLNSVLLINVPGVGTHSTTRLTCALKNLFGLLPEKRKFSVYHPLGIDEIVADIYQAVKPDLNIVDAGKKILLGTDALAVDVAACRFVKLDPLKVDHLRLISQDQEEKLEEFIKKVKVVEV
ncbi:MAG: DUF362 domain-containing protein [Candidatus Bathyarchaeota archaeon]|nr:DUF362 domain-containing protein [Candidatus Bathyarchaeota archaeon]